MGRHRCALEGEARCDHAICRSVATPSDWKVQAESPRKPAEAKSKMTPAEQQRRFIEAAREAGCSEDEAEFEAIAK